MQTDTAIEAVYETALIMAAYRAIEFNRKDALFRDHLAQKLSGLRGVTLAASLPGKSAKHASASYSVRTRLFDDLVLEAVNERGVGAVLNLGAGLDTRPYRLPVPNHLWWVEVDLPK